eukprot:scaffold7438_cov983-Pinguiococcus_pyrenoidosus.AAC.1
MEVESQSDDDDEATPTLAEAKACARRLHAFVLENLGASGINPSVEEKMNDVRKAVAGLVECVATRQSSIEDFFS